MQFTQNFPNLNHYHVQQANVVVHLYLFGDCLPTNNVLGKRVKSCSFRSTTMHLKDGPGTKEANPFSLKV